jgi:hypothetical protein
VLPPGRLRWPTALACSALVVVPFLVVTFPPVTDLPQHVAQVRLLADHLRDPASSPYVVQWLTPYSLGYAVMGLCWAVFPPLVAGRAALILLGLATTLAVHAVARGRGRPIAAAVLATLPFFSHPLYWGFYSFLWGWPLFLVWFLLTSDDGAPTRGRMAALILAGLGLYFAHVLWLLAAVGWTVGSGVVLRSPARRLAERLLALVPALVLTGMWFTQFRETEFGQGVTSFGPGVSLRLQPEMLVKAVLGGLRGPVEQVVVVVLLLWMVGGLVSERGRLRAAVDGRLLLLGGCLFAGYLFLPSLTHNTIFFHTRWMPAAVVAIVLAMPAPRVPAAVAIGALAAFVLVTSQAWRRFEASELDGLGEAIAGAPDRPRILGLSFEPRSKVVATNPFVHQSVWAQVLHGGRVGFSFAQYTPSLVVFAAGEGRPRWPPMLEWHAERARRVDLLSFDVVILNGELAQHAAFARIAGVEPVTSAGHWRLYRIHPDEVLAGGAPSEPLPVPRSEDP